MKNEKLRELNLIYEILLGDHSGQTIDSFIDGIFSSVYNRPRDLPRPLIIH